MKKIVIRLVTMIQFEVRQIVVKRRNLDGMVVTMMFKMHSLCH